jgi:NAD(P)-dependent dehydrogenase (short-subunit alcohol dehydrogenase family)
MNSRQRVAVVTGGGGGIGAAIAEEMGRSGWFVVTVDPLVTLDGTQQAPISEETTADRIEAGGGSAMTSAVSVTDREALVSLFAGLAREHGPLDAVVNVAGITRQTGFAHGSAEDWRAVLDVHLGGFLNILGAALPHMTTQGHGSILGVTSGSGWRAANAGAYSCAKRAIASLVWQLGRQMPPHVTVNAISPIAATRMVAAAAERARKAGGGGGSGGLSLFDSMPQPAEVAPLATHLVSDAFRWCSGRVIFAGGSELAVIDQPRLLELVRTDGEVPTASVLPATVPRSLVQAEANQASDGGGNPRFGALFAMPPSSTTRPVDTRSCLLVSDRTDLIGRVASALEAQSIVCHQTPLTSGFALASDALKRVVEMHGPVDAIVLVPAASPPSPLSLHDGWQRTLTEHAGIVRQIEDDAGWARAASDYAATSDRPVRLLTLVDAVDSGGRSRAQASAQLSRAARDATGGRVVAISVSLEDRDHDLSDSLGEVVVYLVGDSEALLLGGAELVLRAGWFGIRSHPRPIGSITYGGPSLPEWFDETIEEILGVTDPGRGVKA